MTGRAKESLVSLAVGIAAIWLMLLLWRPPARPQAGRWEPCDLAQRCALLDNEPRLDGGNPNYAYPALGYAVYDVAAG